MPLLKNNYNTKCIKCKCQLPQGEGWAYKATNYSKWEAFCNKCLPVQRPATRRELTVDGKVFVTPFNKDELHYFRSFPGAHFVDEKRGGPYWEVSLEEIDRPRVLEIAKLMNLTIPSELIIEQKVAENTLDAANKGAFFYQQEGIQFLHDGAINNRGRLLADDMGLGKTNQAVSAIPKECGAVIVCPASLKENWVNEFIKWRPDVKTTILNGLENWSWPGPQEAVIISFKSLPERFRMEDACKGNDWTKQVPNLNNNDEKMARDTVLIVDECHRLGNNKSSQTLKVGGLSLICKSVFGLTGTPLKNRANHLLSMLNCLNLLKDTFGTIGGFKKAFNAQKVHVGRGIYITQWGEPTPSVPTILRKSMLRRTKAEVLDQLPPMIHTNIQVQTSHEAEKMMDDLWDEFGFQMNSELPPFEKFSLLRAKLAEERIEAMVEFVEDCEEQENPLVVFSAHKAPLKELAEREGWRIIDGDTPMGVRQSYVDEFQAGKLKGIGCSINAAGVGLTLTYATTMLFVDKAWNPSDNDQAAARCHRIGQLNTVNVYNFVSNHILDRHVQKLLDFKVDLNNKAIEGKLTQIERKSEEGESSEAYLARQTQEVNVQETTKEDNNRYVAEVFSWLDSNPEVEEDEAIPF